MACCGFAARVDCSSTSTGRVGSLRRSINRFMACNSQFLRVPGGFFCINDRNTTQPLTNVRR